jgi:hypothetical protein
MKKSIHVGLVAAGVAVAGAVAAQGMLLDYAADQVIAKFAASSCDELKAKKAEPKSDKQKEALQYLKNDAQARKFFLDRVAAPVANKLFQCRMIP